jgi:hypothetical protein
MNTPLESFIFVDHRGLDDKITTTTLTPRRHDFRGDALVRDGPVFFLFFWSSVVLF